MEPALLVSRVLNHNHYTGHFKQVRDGDGSARDW